MRQTFQPGNQVTVREGGTIFEYVRALPRGLCAIREEGLAPNGKPYADQIFDESLLQHAVTDEMLRVVSLGTKRAGRKDTLSAPVGDVIEVDGRGIRGLGCVYQVNLKSQQCWVKKTSKRGHGYLSAITSPRKIKRLLKLAGIR